MEGISTAIYWRFLYEQCGGLEVIRQALITLYSGEIVNINETADMVSWLPEILNQTLANASCPFTTYQESLNAFAQALYALHMQEGRCKVPGESGICGLSDPNHMYNSPTTSKLSYSGEVLNYGASEQNRPAGVPSSFGTDFIEIEIGPDADGQSLMLEIFGEDGAAATFNIQVWELTLTGKQIASASEVVTLLASPEGHVKHTIPNIDTSIVHRLAVIITRVDAQESADPIGAYTLVVHSGID
jgi:hypothetical protein